MKHSAQNGQEMDETDFYCMWQAFFSITEMWVKSNFYNIRYYIAST